MNGDLVDILANKDPLDVLTLSLSHRDLALLPSDLGNLANLTHLDASENSLDSLPESFGRLAQLNTVNLAKNMFTSVPVALAQCRHLTHVSLEMNFISVVPDCFCSLPSLRQVKLSYNHISELPVIPSVVELYLTHNKLTRLPNDITRMTRLVLLALEHNLQLPGSYSPNSH